MLARKMDTNTGASRERCGMTLEHVDSKALSASAEIAIEAADGLVASRGRDDWITLMQALSQLTKVHADAGDPHPLFAADTLRAKCAELDPKGAIYWLGEEDTGRKKFSKAWERLEASFPGLETNLQQRAAKRRSPSRPALRTMIDGLDKRSKLYGLSVTTTCLPEQAANSASQPQVAWSTQPSDGPAIEYIEEMEVYPIPGIHRPIRINVQGWRSTFMFVPLIVAWIAGGFGLWLLLQFWMSELPVRVIFQWTVLIAIVSGMLAWIAWPFYRLIDQKIVMAPTILQLNSRFYHQLVIRKEGEAKVVRMVRFTGTCPLCGGLVEIQQGTGPYRRRYVGACERNPVEHLFSFDHVLRCGTSLRNSSS